MPLTIYRRHSKSCGSKDSQKCRNPKHPCKIWVYGTLLNGRRIRESLETRDWNTAETKRHEYEKTGEQPVVATGKTTIEEWRNRLLENAKAEKLSPETIRKYEHLFKQLLAFAQDRGLRFVDDFDLDTLTQFRATWNDAPLSASKKLERLRSIFRFACDRGWIVRNPALKLKKPKVENKETLPFTDDEMVRILKAAKDDPDPRVLTFILVMRYSGLRISDTATLRVSSLQGRHIALRMKKTGEPVKVLLPEFVADMLRGIPRKNAEYFFWTGTSKLASVCDTWRKSLSDVFVRAKVAGGHPHRLRDTFAVALLRQHVPMEVVSRMLGHTSTKITEKHYSPWVQSRQEAADRVVEAANGYHEYERLVRGKEAEVIPLRKKA